MAFKAAFIFLAIELCGGFGNSGTARIAAAVEGKADVRAVRFDCHPGLGGKSEIYCSGINMDK